MKVSNYDQRCPPAYTRRYMGCEKCWFDSYDMWADHVEKYHKLLLERKDNPCSPQQQSGQWWNEELQLDERWLL